MDHSTLELHCLKALPLAFDLEDCSAALLAASSSWNLFANCSHMTNSLRVFSLMSHDLHVLHLRKEICVKAERT